MIEQQKKKKLQLLIKKAFKNGTSERELSDWFLDNKVDNKMHLMELTKGELNSLAREVIEVRKNTQIELVNWSKNKEKKNMEDNKNGYGYIDKEFLEKHYIKQGMEVEEIAEMCGCVPNTIYTRIRKYRIKSRPKRIHMPVRKSIEKRVLQELLNSGLALTEIAKKCDCCTSTLRKIIKEHDIELKDNRKKRRVVIEKNTLEDLINEGCSIRQIQHKLGYSYITVKSYLKEYNLSI